MKPVLTAALLTIATILSAADGQHVGRPGGPPPGATPALTNRLAAPAVATVAPANRAPHRELPHVPDEPVRAKSHPILPPRKDAKP